MVKIHVDPTSLEIGPIKWRMRPTYSVRDSDEFHIMEECVRTRVLKSAANIFPNPKLDRMSHHDHFLVMQITSKSTPNASITFHSIYQAVILKCLYTNSYKL